MAQSKRSAAQAEKQGKQDQLRQGSRRAGQAQGQAVLKPESSSEYEGAASRRPTGNPGDEIKTESSSSSGE